MSAEDSPGGSVVEPACQCRRHEFEPCSRKIPHAAEQLSPCTTAPGPVLLRPEAATSEAHVPWSQCSATRDVTAKRSHALQLESSPHSTQLEKSPCGNEDSAQPKIKKHFVKVLAAQSCPTLCNPMDWNLCPWGSPSKNTGVGCHSLLQGTFPTQGSNLGLLHLKKKKKKERPTL